MTLAQLLILMREHARFHAAPAGGGPSPQKLSSPLELAALAAMPMSRG
jgi:hypothetical protein